MNAQTVKQETTSIRDIEWNARVRKVVSLSFLATGLGTVLILGFGTFLGN
jgi:hypothetical protein